VVTRRTDLGNLKRMNRRLSALEAARAIAGERYPLADLVILAGSVAIGLGTPTSDLDLVVVSVQDEDAPFRESFTDHGWPVEAFVHTPHSLRGFMRMDVAERRRSMPRMVSSGKVVRDGAGLAGELRDEALRMIDAGPPAPSEDELTFRRYCVTDALEDLRGDPNGDEAPVTAAQLAKQVGELQLILAGAWIGTGKWLLRELRETDPAFAHRFVSSVRASGEGNAEALMRLAGDVLDASGGPMFDGYRASGKSLLQRFENEEGNATPP
jgi:hypothetical protein